METRPDEEDIEALRDAGEDRPRLLAELFEQNRGRLLRMVHLRMDPKLRARVDPSDVLQEAYVEISTRLGDYLAEPRVPFFIWLRLTTAQRIVALHRHHIGTQKRDVRRQIPIERGVVPAVSSAVMAQQLVGVLTTPSGAAMKAEARQQIEEALDAMSPQDREVLVLRHFEELSNGETAAELGIEESAASKRYLRALQRLRRVLESVGLGESMA